MPVRFPPFMTYGYEIDHSEIEEKISDSHDPGLKIMEVIGDHERSDRARQKEKNYHGGTEKFRLNQNRGVAADQDNRQKSDR
jgi:hypothetical protein